MGFSVRLRVGLLGGMVVDVLVLDATSVAFFIVAVSNLHSIGSIGRLPFPPWPHQHLLFVGFVLTAVR